VCIVQDYACLWKDRRRGYDGYLDARGSRADHDDSSALAYGVTGLRVVFAIDRARRVTVSHVGFGSEGFIERMREAIESGGREQRKQTAPPHA
jgi:hypothetical protein